MNCNELSTVEHYHIPVITFIFDNQTLGMVRQWQNLFYGQRYSQTVLEDAVDYVKVAEGLGCTAYRVTKKEELADVLKAAVKAKGPVVIDCVIKEDDKVFPMVPGGQPLEAVFDADDMRKDR